MPHPGESVVRGMYEAINRRDMAAVAAAFAEDAVWHGSGSEITGGQAIAGLVSQLIQASGDTLHVELHDITSSDEHVVALQITRAERNGRSLEDSVAYVFHVTGGKITEAWFTGDPRIQDEFWSA